MKFFFKNPLGLILLTSLKVFKLGYKNLVNWNEDWCPLGSAASKNQHNDTDFLACVLPLTRRVRGTVWPCWAAG